MSASRPLFRHEVIALACASAMTALTGFQVYVRSLLHDGDGGMSWYSSLLWTASVWYVWALLAPFIIVLAARWPVERGKRFLLRFARLIGLGAACILVHAALVASVMWFDPGLFSMPAPWFTIFLVLLGGQTHWGVLVYACIVALVHVAVHVRREQAALLAKEALRAEAANAQLAALSRQMQPHFLFNALNALVSMQGEGSRAQIFTVRLADMLRILLQNGERATATLADELALTEAYLQIERARLGARLRTRFEVAEAAKSCMLPAFILQPLVENAITHGISRALGGGEIAIVARRDEADVRIEVSNTCVAQPGRHRQGLQIALPNCRRRLVLMYGAMARFEAGFVAHDRFRAAIVVPAQVAAA